MKDAVTNTNAMDPVAAAGPDPVFALLGAHTPPWTRAQVVARTSITLNHWLAVRKGRANWCWDDLRAVAPLVGSEPATLARLLEQSGRYVRPDDFRHSPRHTRPVARSPRRSQPSAPAPNRAA